MATLCLAWTVTLTGQGVGAQSGARADLDAPWVRAWAPLAPLGDLGRAPPALAAPPDLLRTPAARVGLLWTAGVVAAGAFEVADARGELRLDVAGESGAYRRPLDEDGLGVTRLAGSRWQRLSRHAAVFGAVTAERADSDFGSFTPAPVRHSSDSFLFTDTTTTGLQHTRIRLEGAYGRRFGAWAAGLAFGLDLIDDRTEAARLPRFGRSATPAVAASIARAIDEGALRIATYGRWLGGAQNVRFIALPTVVGVIYPLHGYDEPEAAVFNNRVVIRHTDRSAIAGGIAAGGRVAGAAWAVFGERTRRNHDHFTVRREDAPTDRWRATGWRAGGATAAGWFADAVRVHVEAEYQRLESDAFRADLEGSIFRTAESLLRGAAELRFAQSDAPWRAAARFDLTRAYHLRRDFLAETATDIVTWTPAASASLALGAGSRTTFAAGAAVAWHSASAALPAPETLGPTYARIAGPELALYVNEARLLGGTVGIRHGVAGASTFVLEGAYQHTEPTGPAGVVPLVPGGERSTWRITAAVVLGG